MNKKVKISGVIICLNEEHTIARAILSLQKVTDEVIVVDSKSTDRTVDIAKQTGATVFVKDWEGYGPTKNFAHLQAEHDWILSLDADEEMDESLIQQIVNIDPDPSVQYQFKIVMNYLGKALKYTEYAPHWKPRFFNKQHYYWDERVVHEKLQAKSHPKSMRLKGELLHFSFKDREHHLNKIDHYAMLSAKELIRKGKTPSTIKRIFGPTYRFLRSYVLKLGILEGKEGYFISKMGAVLVRKRHAYFDQIKEGNEI